MNRRSSNAYSPHIRWRYVFCIIWYHTETVRNSGKFRCQMQSQMTLPQIAWPQHWNWRRRHIRCYLRLYIHAITKRNDNINIINDNSSDHALRRPAKYRDRNPSISPSPVGCPKHSNNIAYENGHDSSRKCNLKKQPPMWSNRSTKLNNIHPKETLDRHY